MKKTPNIGKMRRKYAREQFKKVASGESLVSDQERKQAEQQFAGNAQRMLGAQQQMINQAAGGQGGFSGAQLQGATMGMAEAGTAAALQGTAAANQAVNQLEQARLSAAHAMGKEMHDKRRQDFQAVGQTFKDVFDRATQVAAPYMKLGEE